MGIASWKWCLFSPLRKRKLIVCGKEKIQIVLISKLINSLAFWLVSESIPILWSIKYLFHSKDIYSQKNGQYGKNGLLNSKNKIISEPVFETLLRCTTVMYNKWQFKTIPWCRTIKSNLINLGHCLLEKLIPFLSKGVTAKDSFYKKKK